MSAGAGKNVMKVKMGLLGEWPYSELFRFFTLVLQLGLLLLVLRQFQIESNAFLRVAVLAFVGFAVHYFLPMRFRLPFFLLLSLAGIGIIFGISGAAWLVGIGLVLIGICHLPFPFYGRVSTLVVAGAALAVLRLDWIQAPWSPAVWPILGSMFMFRLMIYLYDVSNEKTPQSFTQSLSYFFMLPNVCFPLFPVVDYKTFKRNYYDTESHQIYQTGINWMTRGVIHLILYRFIYYYLTLAPAEIASPKDLVQFVVTTFLLYLRISGQFHLIVGMLHLFGFRLPETHHLYFLASSFTDVWRRINIYWKDFMMKLFYYPMYFRLRARGATLAMILSTLFVFFVTWLLHSFQWFWLRGSVLLTVPDVAFYGIFAVLVVGNSLYELKYGRRRTLVSTSLTLAGSAKKGAATIATFLAICLLWSMWQSESLMEWFSLWDTVGSGSVTGLSSVPILLAGGGIVGSIAVLKDRSLTIRTSQFFSFLKSPAANLLLLLFLGVIGIQSVYVQLGPSVATFVNSLRSGRLSRVDVAMLEKGYYENLIRVERFNSQLWELYMNRPATWLDVVGDGLERFTGDFRYKELVPSFVAFTTHGRVSTNRWGMRDSDYEKIPSPNTFRIALLGASSVMGWGVNDGATFEAVLERRLNAERAHKPNTRYEILNFAVPGYDPLKQLLVLDKALEFKPAALFYVATGREASRAALQLAEAASGKVSLPFEYLNEMLRKAGVPPSTSEAVASRRLMPFREELLTWTYQHMVNQLRQRNILPVLIFLPQMTDGQWQEETPTILRIAREAGFKVLDLSDIFKSRDVTSLRLADWDYHPNTSGHNLIASELYALLTDNRQEILPDKNNLKSIAR